MDDASCPFLYRTMFVVVSLFYVLAALLILPAMLLAAYVYRYLLLQTDHSGSDNMNNTTTSFMQRTVHTGQRFLSVLDDESLLPSTLISHDSATVGQGSDEVHKFIFSFHLILFRCYCTGIVTAAMQAVCGRGCCQPKGRCKVCCRCFLLNITFCYLANFEGFALCVQLCNLSC